MPEFRKKPVEVCAVRWTGSNVEEVLDELCPRVRTELKVDVDGAMLIETLKGKGRANRGDWIIRGVKGELYPCRADIFEATYEAVTA